MHKPGTANVTRLIGRMFLRADLEAGFALLRATAETETIADRAFGLRQVKVARRVLQQARRRCEEMHEQDAGAFAARLADLERATDAADKSARGGAVTVTA